MSFQLRDYQVDLIDRVHAEWSAGNRRVKMQLPTGAGKSVVFGAVARRAVDAGKRVLAIAHREELIVQGAAHLTREADTPVGIIKAGYAPEPLFKIQMASIQTLVNRVEWVGHFDLIIVDESHHSPAASYQKVLGCWPDAQILGVTATPVRSDGVGFDDLFDVLVCGPTVRSLIEDGYLSPFKLYADAAPMKTKGVRTTAGDYNTKQLARANDAGELAGSLIDSYRQHAAGGRCIVFAITCAHSLAIANAYNDAGIPAAHLDGNSSSDERKEKLEEFRDGKIKVLSNVGLFTEGFDLPSIEVCQIARPTKSLALWLQMVGRALRISEGKDLAVLLDHTENYLMHGLPNRRRAWMLEGVEDAEVEVSVNKKREVVELEPEPLQPMDVDLVEVEDEADGDILAEWQQVINDLEKLRCEREYKEGWIQFKLIDLRPPLEVWQAYGQMKGYKAGWAWHKHQECVKAMSVLEDKKVEAIA